MISELRTLTPSFPKGFVNSEVLLYIHSLVCGTACRASSFIFIFFLYISRIEIFSLPNSGNLDHLASS